VAWLGFVMKKMYHILVILLMISPLAHFHASKLMLPKREAFRKAKIHPHTNLLIDAKHIQPKIDAKNPTWEKLLVILVDFQEEVNPNTAGNGKFLLEPDPSYLSTIGSPPHDRTYFEANFEALKYYYRAVSNESYNLQYDVYPKDKQAYTLPQTMGYYNPPNAESSVFLARMEEYFKTAFETADADDPEIDFAQYSHFMIVHAGSDWQHDVNGDSPSDIPSFFIRVGAGKEAVVDNGAVRIFTASNVPSTISQDFSSFEENGKVYHTGYGALNAVIAHEFGHSLGLVDLYNVRSFQPMVGVFDIMDSGGGGILIDTADNGDYVFVEGVLPVLPGAFSRELLFGESMQERGFFKDITELPLYQDMPLLCSSSKQVNGNPRLSMIKIPLSEKEYVLLENRSVDPDGDGGTAVHGTLDSRVILYPTSYADNSTPPAPTYEYDYLLPSFIKSDGSSVGGGILAWHIDESIIYDQGSTGNDGNFSSNFENNSINTNYYKRGVKIIEADALPDIGYVYSYYWTGTAYEYFHKHKPVLDVDGNFVNWSQSIWKDKLGNNTTPPLLTNTGVPALYNIAFNSNPARLMNIQLGLGFFDGFQRIQSVFANEFPAPIISSSFTQMPELPLLAESLSNNNSIMLYTLNPMPGSLDWQNLSGSFELPYIQWANPFITSDVNTNSIPELATHSGTDLMTYEFANDDLLQCLHRLDTDISTIISVDSALLAATAQKLYHITKEHIQALNIAGIKKLAIAENLIYALGGNQLHVIDVNTFTVQFNFDMPTMVSSFEPLLVVDAVSRVHYLYFFSDRGDLYVFRDSKFTKLFSNPFISELPTQLGVFKTSSVDPLLFFGLADRVYILRYDGTFEYGYPKTFEGYSFSQLSFPKALSFTGEPHILIPANQLGYLTLNASGDFVPEYSFFWQKRNQEDLFYWAQAHQKLYWIVPDINNSIAIYSQSAAITNPILFSGFRNEGTGVFFSSFAEQNTNPTTAFDAYVFPNPVSSNEYRLRLINPSMKTEIVIFDISGKLILQKSIDHQNETIRDILLDSTKLSSGVYIATVKSSGKAKKFKFAIEK